MNIAWITDIHLDHLQMMDGAEAVQKFAQSLREGNWEAVVCTGDISSFEVPVDGTSWVSQPDGLMEHLGILMRESGLPFYFVLGNHDYWGSSIKDVRWRMERFPSSPHFEKFHYLGDGKVYQLTEKTVLTGCDGWSDGLAASFVMSSVVLNDYYFIEELKFIPGKFLLAKKLEELGAYEARVARKVLAKALDSGAEKVLFLTHPPPFREACWHEGKLSTNQWMPHFVCMQVGEVLMEVALEHPETQFTVLCGHSHGVGTYQPLENLLVKTGGAVYGAPVISEVLSV